MVGENGSLNLLNMVADRSGTICEASGVSVEVSGSRGSYRCLNLTAAKDLRHGYIDDSSDNVAPTVMVSGIPFPNYRVIVYHSTDTANVPFGYDTINGENYSYENGILTNSIASWGASGPFQSAVPIAEGTNMLISPVQTNSALIVIGHRGSGGARGCIAAIQIIQAIVSPTVDGDDGATVYGDESSGYIVKPSDDNTNVVITIPEGILPEKVTVEVSVGVDSLDSNGANVKVMKGEYDITKHLDLEAVTHNGVINLASAQVKEEVVKETLDIAKGAEVDFSDPESPELITTETKPGLTYTLLEGATLEEMMSCTTGDSKFGDGTKWVPTITVKGGTSGFYTIKVEK